MNRNPDFLVPDESGSEHSGESEVDNGIISFGDVGEENVFAYQEYNEKINPTPIYEIETNKSPANPKHPSASLEIQQILYVFAFHGIINALFCGGINFGINYAIGKKNVDNGIELWKFPVGVATTLLVTVLVQSFLIFMICGTLVTNDVYRNGRYCAPLEVKKKSVFGKLTNEYPRMYFGLCCYSLRDFGAAAVSAGMFGLHNLVLMYLPTIGIIALIATSMDISTWSSSTWYIFISCFTGVLGYGQAVFTSYVGLVASCTAIKRVNRILKKKHELECSAVSAKRKRRESAKI